MIFIVVKFEVKPDWSDRWLDLVHEFTEATRAEPGNLWFDWSRSVDNPNEFVLVEAFEEGTAEAHVTSEHFLAARREFPQALVKTPSVISESIEATGWNDLVEFLVE